MCCSQTANKRVSRAHTPRALCRQAPPTVPTRDLDTDKSYRSHVNTESRAASSLNSLSCVNCGDSVDMCCANKHASRPPWKQLPEHNTTSLSCRHSAGTFLLSRFLLQVILNAHVSGVLFSCTEITRGQNHRYSSSSNLQGWTLSEHPLELLGSIRTLDIGQVTKIGQVSHIYRLLVFSSSSV